MNQPSNNPELPDSSKCEWRLGRWEYEPWVGTCGIEWSLHDGTPKDNDMNFCPKCGKPLVEIKREDGIWVEVDDDGEEMT